MVCSAFTKNCAFGMNCLIKWTMYVLAIMGIILAFMAFSKDKSDQSNAGEDSSKSNPSLCLAIMILAQVPIIVHFFSSRLLLIVLSIFLNAIAIILRFTSAPSSRFELTIPSILLIAVGSYYTMHVYKASKSGFWDTFWQPEDAGAAAAVTAVSGEVVGSGSDTAAAQSKSKKSKLQASGSKKSHSKK